MDSKFFLRTCIEEVKVELDDLFDRNFEQKGFFGNQWQGRQHYDDGKGSLLNRSGELRRSLISRSRGMQLVYTSDKPYGRTHNNSERIKVTTRMKRFFWAKYYEASGKITFKKNGEKRGTKANQQLSEASQFWRNMALMRTGSEIVVPQRQFVGEHPRVRQTIEEVISENVHQFLSQLAGELQQKAGAK